MKSPPPPHSETLSAGLFANEFIWRLFYCLGSLISAAGQFWHLIKLWVRKGEAGEREAFFTFVYATNIHETLLSTVGLSEKASRALFKEASASLADIFFSEMRIAWERNVTRCMWKIPSHCLLGTLCRQPLLYLFSLRTHTLSLALVFDTIPRAVNQPSCNAWLRWRGGVGCVAVLFHSTNVHSECQNRSGRNYKLCLETWV